VKYSPAGAEFSIDPYFTHVFHAMFAGFGSLGTIFDSKKAKNGVLRVNFGAVAAGTPSRRSKKRASDDPRARILMRMDSGADRKGAFRVSTKCSRSPDFARRAARLSSTAALAGRAGKEEP
jgi:hypothetical protein